MKIKVINPNTTASMTQKIGKAALAVAMPGTEIIACNPSMGPVSIEGHYDKARFCPQIVFATQPSKLPDSI